MNGIVRPGNGGEGRWTRENPERIPRVRFYISGTAQEVYGNATQIGF